MNNQHSRGSTQQGVGLIEVMIALFILAFGALAIGNVQLTALSSANISTSHFAVNSIAEEIAEKIKADSAQAANGLYNTTFDEATAMAGMNPQVTSLVNTTKQAAASSLKDGALQIACTPTDCTVSLRWRESITAGQTQQIYNLRFPLHFN